MSKRTRLEGKQSDARQNAGSEAWQAGIEMGSLLTAGWRPEPMQLWGVVLRPGDRLLFDLQTLYARFYGGSGQYTHTSGLFLGSPAFVIGGLAATTMANRRARTAAAYEAQPRWREQQHTRLLVTEFGLVCECQGQWLRFDYAAITGFYPDLVNYGVGLDFDTCAPLALTGPAMPFLAVYLTFQLYGHDGLLRHPGLEPLRAKLPAPPVPAISPY